MDIKNISSSITNNSFKKTTPLSVLQNSSDINVERRRNLLGGSRVQHIQNTLPELPNEVWLNIVSQLTFKEIRKVKHVSQAFRDFSNYFNKNKCPKYTHLDFSRSTQLAPATIVNDIMRPRYRVDAIKKISLGGHTDFSNEHITRIICQLESYTYTDLEVLEVMKENLERFQKMRIKLKLSDKISYRTKEVRYDRDPRLTFEIPRLTITEDTRYRRIPTKKTFIDVLVKLNEQKNSIDATQDYAPTNSEWMQITEGSEESIFQKIIGVAIYCESKIDIEWLLEAGMSANVRNTDDRFPMNWPAFHIAAQIEYAPFSMAKLLLEAGADITAFDASGMTALHRIAHCELFEDSNSDLYSESIITLKDIIRYIFKKDPNCAHAIDNEGNTPLQYAVQYSPAEIVGFLIAKGSDITAVNKQGKNLLHLVHSSTYNSRVEIETSRIIRMIVRSLKEESRNYINAVDIEGNTPLHYAVRYESLEIIKLLIEKGAHIDAINNKGENLLEYVQRFYRQYGSYSRPEIEDFLISKGLSLFKHTASKATNTD